MSHLEPNGVHMSTENRDNQSQGSILIIEMNRWWMKFFILDHGLKMTKNVVIRI